MTIHRPPDDIDALVLGSLIQDPEATNSAIAQSTGLSRNTVRARLARYVDEGVLRSVERRIDPAFLGFPLSAYMLLRVTQRRLDTVARALGEIPEVLEIQGLSGLNDLLVQVAARDADDLYRIAGRVLETDGVERTDTGLVMRELLGYRVEQLIDGKAPKMSRRPPNSH